MWTRRNTNLVCYLGIPGLLLSYWHGSRESKKHIVTATILQVLRLFIRFALSHLLSRFTYGGTITMILYFYVHIVWFFAIIIGINDTDKCKVRKK